jgi:hypothetical protein
LAVGHFVLLFMVIFSVVDFVFVVVLGKILGVGRIDRGRRMMNSFGDIFPAVGCVRTGPQFLRTRLVTLRFALLNECEDRA